MAVIYEETQSFIPEIPLKILILTLVATDLFVLVCSITDLIEGYWQFAAFTAVCAAIILVLLFVKIRIVIDDENLTVSSVKKYTVPLANIIDVKKGDIDILRNYSGWGIKKVKFKNYTVNGIDGAVSLKLMGRIVLTMTTSEPDRLYDIFYAHRRQD